MRNIDGINKINRIVRLSPRPSDEPRPVSKNVDNFSRPNFLRNDIIAPAPKRKPLLNFMQQRTTKKYITEKPEKIATPKKEVIKKKKSRKRYLRPLVQKIGQKIKSFFVFLGAKCLQACRWLGQKISFAAKWTWSKWRFVAYPAVVIIIIYSSLATLLIMFRADNIVLRKITKVLPVPVLFSKIGWVNYYDYIDVKKEITQNNASQDSKELRAEIQYQLIVNLITKEISDQYRTNDQDNIKRKFLADESINEAPLMRIKKIKNLLDQGKSFDEVVEKFGYERDNEKYFTKDEIMQKFRIDIAILQPGQISNAIANWDDYGYYVIKYVEQQGELYKIQYVFVSAKSIESYAREAVNNHEITDILRY